MNLSHNAKLHALFAISALFCGCNSGTGSDETATGIVVQGLTETRTIAACEEQVLQAYTESSTGTPAFTWNVAAPENASYELKPTAGSLYFVARTPGEYLISVSDCPEVESGSEKCATTEFAITVVVGSDLNRNGVGDQCEASSCIPACEDRACGLDPICNTSCGTCGDGQSCDETVGQCEAVCVPACEDRACGLDPICNTSCGTCGDGQTCDEAAGECKAACVPACEGRTCGLDPVCNTSCGTCGEGTSCDAQGHCQAVEQPGRVVTIVMALTDRRLGFTDPHFNQRARLIEQSVDWVSPVDEPKVLVVLDDTASDWAGEAKLIRSTLQRRRISANYVREPAGGLSAAQLSGYDVVWFSNPALPVDDPKTIATLTAFARQGGGLVLQGDDITQPSEMQPLTRLRNVNTGKYYCGRHIDDDRGASYRVTIERSSHPVTARLLGNEYYYGDDIDHATLIPDTGATVVAWASVRHCHHDTRNTLMCPKLPVIVAYDMNQ